MDHGKDVDLALCGERHVAEGAGREALRARHPRFAQVSGAALPALYSNQMGLGFEFEKGNNRARALIRRLRCFFLCLLGHVSSQSIRNPAASASVRLIGASLPQRLGARKPAMWPKSAPRLLGTGYCPRSED